MQFFYAFVHVLFNFIHIEVFLIKISERFVRSKMPYGHKFFMDNDPKHTSQSTKQFMLLNNINHFETPPQSPDLMPIEMVCLIKDYFIKYAIFFQILHFISGME
jgi:hypothetical protein